MSTAKSDTQIGVDNESVNLKGTQDSLQSRRSSIRPATRSYRSHPIIHAALTQNNGSHLRHRLVQHIVYQSILVIPYLLQLVPRLGPPVLNHPLPRHLPRLAPVEH